VTNKGGRAHEALIIIASAHITHTRTCTHIIIILRQDARERRETDAASSDRGAEPGAAAQRAAGGWRARPADTPRGGVVVEGRAVIGVELRPVGRQHGALLHRRARRWERRRRVRAARRLVLRRGGAVLLVGDGERDGHWFGQPVRLWVGPGPRG